MRIEKLVITGLRLNSIWGGSFTMVIEDSNFQTAEPADLLSGRFYDSKNSPLDFSDLELIELARAEDHEAFGKLWRRHYRSSIHLARSLTSRHDPEDLTQEAFMRIFEAVRRNGGPSEAFRAYLYSTQRSISINWNRYESRVTSLEDVTAAAIPADSFENQLIEGTLMSLVFGTLKEEWRFVLWLIEIEGMTPRQAAPLLGRSSNATSALAYRARNALRSAWLQANLSNDNPSSDIKASSL